MFIYSFKASDEPKEKWASTNNGSLPLDGSSGYIPFAPVLDSEALIKIELDIITPECPSNSSSSDTVHIVNVQFNNLDFVG